MLRYAVSGLPADVAAARYLYELAEQAFTRETALFRDGETYAQMPAGLRRTATNSFQIGLGRGISAKLMTLRAKRGRRVCGTRRDETWSSSRLIWSRPSWPTSV